MVNQSSRGRKHFLIGAILVLSLVLVGGAAFLLSSWNAKGSWRLDDAWTGQNLNHPGPVGEKMVAGAVASALLQ